MSQPPRRTFASPVGPLVATLGEDGALVELGRAKVELHGRPPAHPTFAILEEELGRYWSGEEVRFTVPVNAPGTPFQKKVWAALREVPWGRTLTYGELAERVGSNARAVGQANGANPVAIVVPCHRIVGRDGSLVGYAGGLDMKRELLKLERCILL